MIQTYTFTNADFVNGNISQSGAWVSQSNRLRPNDFIDVTNVISVSIKFSGTNGVSLEASISCINVNGQLDQEFYWLTSPASATLPSNITKVAIIFRRSDNADLTPSDLESLTVELNVKGEWIIQNDKLTNTDFLSTPDKPFHGDSPYTFWRIDPNANDGMPYVGLMIGVPVLVQDGAFKDATNLVKVRIPQSCASIGRCAFGNTQLTKVTIASDCTHYNTSFPDGCVVNFYPD